jgi:hypothetical protein
MLPNVGTFIVAPSDTVDRKRDRVTGRYDLPGLHQGAGVAAKVPEMMREQ